MLVGTRTRDSIEKIKQQSIENVALHFRKNATPPQAKSMSYLPRGRSNCPAEDMGTAANNTTIRSPRRRLLTSVLQKPKKPRLFTAVRQPSRKKLRAIAMAKIADRRHSGRISTTILWISLISIMLLLTILMESICLGILYVTDSLKRKDTSLFARQHLLTSPFASTPPAPIPGKYFDFAWVQFVVADELLGWRLAPSMSAISRQHINEYLFITDDNGFIADVDDPPVTLEKSADTYRVIVLGGSTVMGEGAPRPSQNIVGMLRKSVSERDLRGANGGRIEFINAGVDDYNSTQEYLYLVSDLLRFKPDLVIVYDGWNDIRRTDDPSPFRHPRISRRVAQSTSITGSARLLAANLVYLLTLSNYRLGMVELPWNAFHKAPSDAHAPAFSVNLPFDSQNMKSYRQNRRAFLALADDELSVALFLQPLVGTDDRLLSAEEKASWWWPRLDEALRNRIPFYEHARQILADLNKRGDQDNGHRCIADLSHSLSGVSETVYVDSGHLLPKGNEIVASHMLDQLVLCGLLR
jgi:hypothetical protein